MSKAQIEYIKSIKPVGLPNGMDIVKEGIEIGRSIKMDRSPLLDDKGFENYQQYKLDCCKKGEVIFEILLGLATLEEQVDAIKKIYEHGQRTGFDIRTIQCIPSFLVTLPKEYRDNAPKPTSYMVETLEDYRAHQAGVPMQIIFGDQTLSCPNAIETTKNALTVGSARTGLVSQFIWAQPGYYDHKQHIIDMVKSIGMVASKKDDYIICDTFLDDGFPGYAMDHVTYVGYSLLEHYIVRDLIGARHSVSYGNLVPQPVPRMAIALALHKLFGSEDEPAVGYINGTTITQWDHDVETNYAPAAKEMLLEILFERKYKIGTMINPVSITEQITVPTLQDLLNIYGMGSRLREDIEYWDELIDWTPIEKMADLFVEEGKKFFENAMNVLKEAGVNTEDPLEMFMTLKNINASKFEATFHHRTDETGSVIPVEPTVMGRRTLKMKDNVKDDLIKRGLNGDELKGKRLCLVSGDGHSYGLVFMNSILGEFGADVINGGVDIDPPTVLDFADEEGTSIIGISVHNGQGLDYAKQLKELAEKRGKEYHIFLGGMLNGILPGDSEPSDVTDLIKELGVFATNDLYEDIVQIAKW